MCPEGGIGVIAGLLYRAHLLDGSNLLMADLLHPLHGPIELVKLTLQLAVLLPARQQLHGLVTAQLFMRDDPGARLQVAQGGLIITQESLSAGSDVAFGSALIGQGPSFRRSGGTGGVFGNALLGPR